jgi:hypothetical protein
MSIETLFFIVAALVAFIPTIWPMKVEDKNFNWWKSLTLAGRVYIIAFAFFFGTGLYLTISSHNESVVKEIKSNEKIKSDSLLMSNLNLKVAKLYSSDSLYRSAIKKGGYKYDSIKGIIIKPQVNIQNIQNNGRAIQNNAPNQGIQNLGDGDIYLNAKKELTDKGKNLVITEINRLTKDWGVSCCFLSMHSKGNGDIVFHQIKDILDSQSVPYDITFSEYDGQPPPNGISYSSKDGKLKILVGDY